MCPVKCEEFELQQDKLNGLLAKIKIKNKCANVPTTYNKHSKNTYLQISTICMLGVKDREINKTLPIFPYWMLPINWEEIQINK